ncbi:MAG: imidazoleglycerol-phosphate dehydratase HisB [Nitrospirae bacterium]|nr:imidazoleglycerol-phosphate dehydratase HisB [Nitrospirota bacterium]
MRKATVKRTTQETDIELELDLDGTGKYSVETSVPFLDHMLTLMARHGLFDLRVKATGDTQVDYHHLVEDMGIVMGQAIRDSVGDKRGIRRYGDATTPMDETLAQVIVDLSGRAYLVYKVEQPTGMIRDLDASLFEDFFRAASSHAGMNLHVILHYGRDIHHIIEAVFKSFGRALGDAVTNDPRITGVRSTKGIL